jgi:predicted ATPase
VLVDLVRSHRLVTLVGTGGIGKTRLATECARALLPQFADGVWRADLSGISDPECVPAAVAKAACLHLGQASAHDVGAAVMAKSMLVILDNCEHVAEATACVAEAISRLSTSTRVIATSREPLRAEGEHVFRVPGLAVPPGDAVATGDALEYGAMKLFMLHAGAAAEPASEAWLAAAIDVCRMLDGIPLAIELAAARLAALSIEELAAHLAGSLQLLSGGRRTALARHQTLCACIQWSWERLSDSERIVLQRLSRFDGPFSLEEAIEAASRHALDRVAIIDAIARLVGKCLIDAETARRGLRYRLPNTARIFVREHAPEPTEVADVAYMRPKIRLLEDALATPGASPPRARSEWLPTARAYRGAIGQW